MSPALQSKRRALRRSVYFLGTTALTVTGIVALPKDMTYAAPDRLVLTLTTLGIAGIGLAGFAVQLRRFRDYRLRSRYAGASRSIDDTLSYVLHETHLSRRSRLALCGVVYAAVAGSVLTSWPQLAPMVPLHAPLRWLAGASFVALLLQPFLVRKHLINTVYLLGCLRQQASHIGLHRSTKKVLDQSAQDSGMSFTAAGFRWAFDDLCKNFIVFGQPGSGKTVCVLNAILEPLLSVHRDGERTAGLILDPKGAYRAVIEALCVRAGRSADLLILSPDDWATCQRTVSAIAWNPLDTIEDALEVAARIVSVMKVAGGVEARDSFFLDAARLFARHAFTLCRATEAPEPASLLDIHRLSAEPTENAPEYERLLEILAYRYPDTMPQEVQAAIQYMETEWHSMPDKQRAGVRSTINQLIDDFTAPPFDEMISGASTIRIADVIEQGKLLYVHLPLAGRERLSKIVSSFIKLEFQREVLRRPNKSRPSFLFADEYQTLFTSGDEQSDSGFFERSRESRHANVVAVQNLSSFLKRVRNPNDVTNFLGLCAVKVFLRNGERETNEWASNLFGERAEIVVTMSEAAQIGGWLSKNQTSYSRATRALRAVPPEAFAELPIPVTGDPDRKFAGSIVHFGSRGTVEKLRLDWPIHPLQP